MMFDIIATVMGWVGCIMLLFALIGYIGIIIDDCINILI